MVKVHQEMAGRIGQGKTIDAIYKATNFDPSKL